MSAAGTKAPLAKLLIVDDESAQMGALCNTLQDEGYTTTGFSSANAALQALREQEFDLILTDLMMPEMDGIALLAAAQEIDRNLVGIVMTGHGAIDTAVQAMKVGALDYILKPFKLSAVLPVLARALTVRRLRTENIQLREAVAIHELSAAFALTMDYATVLAKVADAAWQQSGGGRAAVLIPVADGNELRVGALRGENASSLSTVHVAIDAQLNDWVSRARQQLARPDTWNDTRFAVEHPMQEVLPGIAIPMLAGGKLVGVLSCSAAQPQRAITLGQLRVLSILAGSAASALEVVSLLQQVRAAEQRYRRLAENAADIVYRYELWPERRFVYMNPAITVMTGYTPEEHYADPDFGLKIVHPEDRSLLRATIDGQLPQDRTTTLRWVRKDGKIIWTEQHNVLLHDDSGRAVAVEGIVRDITERRQAEEAIRRLNEELEGRVRERTAELETANRELESFSYSVSHDLRAPLRAVSGFSSLLLQQYLEQLPPDGQQMLQRVQSGAVRMGQLIEDLLAFSRLGRQPLIKKQLSMSELVQQVLAELQKEREGRNVELRVAELPTAVGDPSLLNQVFVNLLSNAFKFSSRREQAVVEVGYRDEGEEQVFFVRDNGAGFDEKYAAKLFGVFQRLHSTDEFEGTGIGLSIVQQIVRRHGGRIWAEGAVDRGATFYFSLPKTKT